MAGDVDALIADVRKTKPTIANVMQDAANYQTRAELEYTITALRDENNKMREIISESASAIGNGAFISPTCTVGFMAGLPNEIGIAAGTLRSRIEELERERDEAREKAFEEAAQVADRLDPNADDIAAAIRSLGKERT